MSRLRQLEHFVCMVGSANGVIATRRPKYTILTQKLIARYNVLRPLVKCDGVDTVFVLKLWESNLCNTQHDLNGDQEQDVDSAKTAIVEQVMSGECQATTSSLCVSIDGEYQDSDDTPVLYVNILL